MGQQLNINPGGLDGPYPTFLACLPCAQRLKSSTPPLPKLSHPLEQRVELAEITEDSRTHCVRPVGGQWDTCASLIVLLRWLQKSQGNWPRISKERATRMLLCSFPPLLSTASRLHPLSVPSSVTSTILHSRGHTQSPTDTQLCPHSGAITQALIRSLIVCAWHAVRLLCALPGTGS